MNLRTEVKVGDYVWPEGRSVGDVLMLSDWERAQFRFPVHGHGPIESVAVNVAVTGRTPQRKCGGYYQKVRIEWVGDGEPSRFSAGWIPLD